MNTPSQADTSAVANQLARLITAGTTERELVATVARVVPGPGASGIRCRPAGRARSRRKACGDEALMATTPTTQADRVARSLKRLGFRLTRIGRTFTIVDNAGDLVTGTKTGMTLAEIERWIGEHIRRRQNVVGR